MPGAKVASNREKAPLASFFSTKVVSNIPMYHLDCSSDVLRLNAFNCDDVRFMFVSLSIFCDDARFMFVSLRLQETTSCRLGCVQTCPAGPNLSEFFSMTKASN